MNNDYDTYINPVEGKTYISPPIINQYDEEQREIRIITRGIDSEEHIKKIKEKNEILLRQTTKGKYIITAKVYSDNNNIFVLNIQEYTAMTGNPHKLGFAFINDEITKLYNFIRDVQTMQFGSDRYQKLADEEIEHIDLSGAQAEKLFEKNYDLFLEVIKQKLSKEDITAIGYRKKQLDFFSRFLNDSDYFELVKNKRNFKSEKVWQTFFENNQWIFGYGLGYLFLSNLDDKKLEQVVHGYSVADNGKRVDGLMKTRGIISNLCFVEIKTHKTALLENNPYRSSCYAPSKELSGAVAQVQGTVYKSVETINKKLKLKDYLGNPTGEEIYNYQPKAFLVIGNLKEFETEHGINEDKLRSFELYRKNIQNIEIITFDELYERARFIVEYNSEG